MARRSRLRASDADRDYVAERLRDATAEGRLLSDELEYRLDAAFAARTYGELSALLSDLPPEPRRVASPRRVPLKLRPVTVVALVLAFPIALAVAAAAIVAVASLLVAWAIAVSVVALFLGPRARVLGRPWAMGYRAIRQRNALPPWL